MGVVIEIAKREKIEKELVLAPAAQNTIQKKTTSFENGATNPELPKIQPTSEEEIRKLTELGVLGRLKVRTWDKVVENAEKCTEGCALFCGYLRDKFKGEQTKERFWGILKKLNLFSYISDGIITPIFSAVDTLREELTRVSLMAGRLPGVVFYGNNLKDAYVSYKEFREIEQKETLLQVSKILFEVAEVLLSLAVTLASAGAAGAGWKTGWLALKNRIKVSGLFGFGGAIGEELLQGQGYKVDLLRVSENTLGGMSYSLKFGAINAKLPRKLGNTVDKTDALGDVYEVAVIDSERVLLKDNQGASPDLLTMGRRSIGLLTKGAVSIADLKDNPRAEVEKIVNAASIQTAQPRLNLTPHGRPEVMRLQSVGPTEGFGFPEVTEFRPTAGGVYHFMSGESSGLPDKQHNRGSRETPSGQISSAAVTYPLIDIFETIYRARLENDSDGLRCRKEMDSFLATSSLPSQASIAPLIAVAQRLKVILDEDRPLKELYQKIRDELENISQDGKVSKATQDVAKIAFLVLVPESFSFQKIIDCSNHITLSPSSSEQHQLSLCFGIARTCLRRILRDGRLEYLELLSNLEQKWKNSAASALPLISAEVIRDEVDALTADAGIKFLCGEDKEQLLATLMSICPEASTTCEILGRELLKPLQKSDFQRRVSRISYETWVENLMYFVWDAARKLSDPIQNKVEILSLFHTRTARELRTLPTIETIKDTKFAERIRNPFFADLLKILEELINTDYEQNFIHDFTKSVLQTAFAIPGVETFKIFLKNVLWLQIFRAAESIRHSQSEETTATAADHKKIDCCQRIIKAILRYQQFQILTAEHYDAIMHVLERLENDPKNIFEESSTFDFSDQTDTMFADEDEIGKKDAPTLFFPLLVAWCYSPDPKNHHFERALKILEQLKKDIVEENQDHHEQEQDFGEDTISEFDREMLKQFEDQLQFFIQQIQALAAVIASRYSSRKPRVDVLEIAKAIDTRVNVLTPNSPRAPLWLTPNQVVAANLFEEYLAIACNKPKTQILPQTSYAEPSVRTPQKNLDLLTEVKQGEVIAAFATKAAELHILCKKKPKQDQVIAMADDLIQWIRSQPEGAFSAENKNSLALSATEILVSLATFGWNKENSKKDVVQRIIFEYLNNGLSTEIVSEIKTIVYFSVVPFLIEEIKTNKPLAVREKHQTLSRIARSFFKTSSLPEIQFAEAWLRSQLRKDQETLSWPTTAMKYLAEPNEKNLNDLYLDKEIDPLHKIICIVNSLRRRLDQAPLVPQYPNTILVLAQLCAKANNDRLTLLMNAIMDTARKRIAEHDQIIKYLCWKCISLAALFEEGDASKGDSLSIRFLKLAVTFATYINDTTTLDEIFWYEESIANRNLSLNLIEDLSQHLQDIGESRSSVLQFLFLLKYSIKQDAKTLQQAGPTIPEEFIRKQNTLLFLLYSKLISYVRNGNLTLLKDAGEIYKTFGNPKLPKWFISELQNLVPNDVQEIKDLFEIIAGPTKTD